MKTAAITDLALLRRGASVGAMMAALLAPPVAAQNASALLGSIGMTAPVVTAPVVLPTPTTPNEAGLVSAGARALANQARLASTVTLAQQAQAALRDAAPSIVIPNGLVAGGLARVENPTQAQVDAGLAVWQGAALPTVDGNTVTIAQQASRALLSWSSFNVGRETTVNFVQQPDWVVVNRVVTGIDPATGSLVSGNLAPSTILGRITGAGTVVVINQNGVMFGNSAQVAVRSFLASSLELGAVTRVGRVGDLNDQIIATTLLDRNTSFLQNGLLTGGGLVSTVGAQIGPSVADAPVVEGTVTVAGGARITGGDGGFVIIAAPRVVNAGTLSVANGQVSLVAGRRVSAVASTGAANSVDPNLRGLVLTVDTGIANLNPSVRNASVENSAGGIIDAPRGLISMGSSIYGTVTQNGILTSTTSVARNGKIALTGATVMIGADSIIAITPDANGETIPQAAESVAGFKTSIIDIGFANSSGAVTPSNINIGSRALIYAPGAVASIGGIAAGATPIIPASGDRASSFSVVVDADATIDVSGVKNLELSAARNSITITPVKRTELRDTPNYREVSTNPDIFSLNGTTLTVDARLSGVRADGVAWIGSPLLEAAGALGQVGITAPELLTRGGTVTLGTQLFASDAAPSALGTVTVRQGATIDVSGGWVRYAAGSVATSRLLTADGRIVDIGNADPNDNFVGLAGSISATQDRFGIVDVFGNPLAAGSAFEQSFIEGRDAGALVVKASTNTLGGTLFADAFAGTQQVARGREASVAATLTGDTRRLQATRLELPSGGLLSVQAIADSAVAGGGDIVVYAGSGAAPARTASEILISDRLLSGSGLAAVAFGTSGRVSLLAGSVVALAPNGGLTIDAGRSIRFDGTVSTPSGTIAARTYQLTGGSVFRADDDLDAFGALTPGLGFDITVTGALSARGRFVNDLLATGGAYLGAAYADGGSISLTVAPRVLIADSLAADAKVTDVSGSIIIAAGALLDVTAGGSVRADGTALLTARGGSVALINQTNYFQINPDPLTDNNAIIGIDLPTFVAPDTSTRVGTLSPDVYTAEVRIAPNTIRAQGFAGGGSFTLITPDLNFGARAGATGTAIPLDFISTTGFGTFEFQTYTSRVFDNVFAGVRDARTPLLATETVQIHAGETLSLSRAVIPSIQLDSATIDALNGAASGTSLAVLLGSGQPADAFDRRGIAVNFSGLTEVSVQSGGRIDGADGASLTAGTLRNATGGVIRLPGGTIRQAQTLPAFYLNSTRPALAVTSLDEIFGVPDPVTGQYDPAALNAQGIRASIEPGAPILTNAELVTQRSALRAVYLLGELGVGEGVRLEAGSVTDLSGVSIRNPRAVNLGDGMQRIDGRLVAGGALETSAASSSLTLAFGVPRFGTQPFGDAGSSVQRPGLRIDVQAARGPLAAARLDLNGVADAYDVETSAGTFALAPVWSNGGRLSVGAGGTIAGANIDADGGDGRLEAEGGTLTWLDPVLRASDTADRASNLLGAQQIAAAGFDTFVAQRSLTGIGDVSLTLGRGFHVTAQPFTGAADPQLYGVTIASSGRLSIAAPYIRLSSLTQTAAAPVGIARGTGTLTFDAAAIDIAGSVYVDASVAAVRLLSRGEVRFGGVQALNTGLGLPPAGTSTAALSGQFVVNGDLTIQASQLYPVTGTGNLQREIDAQRAGRVFAADAYLIASTGSAATIRIERAAGATPAAPYSAGGNLTIQAANIAQNGVVRVPVGRLTLGSTSAFVLANNTNLGQIVPATASLSFGGTSITSVSAGGLSIPYGTTTDIAEYFFLATSGQRLFAPPAADLRLGGDRIVVAAGATVDLSGGGDLFAYEFASGVGGSRDVLDRRNTDQFSSRNGLQFADGRQVYAIVPSLRDASVALDDPLYAADYANLFNPADAGRRVFLEDAPGLPGGWYTLLPARYALLPGGMRLVENVGSAPGAIGVDATLRDGSIIVGGRYGVAGTTFEDSARRTFTVQSQETLRKFSRIELTSATTIFTDLATRDSLALPRLPSDAARLVLSPESELSINTATRFLSAPATGGRGSQVDLVAPIIEIVAEGAATTINGALRVTAAQLASLNAASLVIGAVRTDNADGTTSLAVGADTIRVANTAADPLGGAELVFAVDGVGSGISFADGATVIANAALTDTRQGNYLVARGGGQTGVGAVVRVANGPERLVSRPGETEETSLLASSLIIGNSAASAGGVLLRGTSVLLDSSRDLVIFDSPLTRDIADNRIVATFLALQGDDVMFAEVPSQFRGLTITRAMEQDFFEAQRLTVTTRSIVGFDARLDRPEAERAHVFNDLRLDVRGIRTYRAGEIGPRSGYDALPEPPPGFDPTLTPQVGVNPQTPLPVTIVAREISLTNSDIDRGTCGAIGFVDVCGNGMSRLLIDAATVRLGSGPMRAYGFALVRVNADAGVLVEGKGFLDVGSASLTFDTPFFGDRALSADPRGRKIQPDLTVLTSGAVSLINSSGLTTPTIAAAPGALLRFGDVDSAVASFSADNVRIRATAGVLAVRSAGSIVVTGNSVVETPGYSRTFGDAADQVTISAAGGTLSLVSLAGDVSLGSATRVSVGGGSGGEAGLLELSASTGRVTLGGAIDAAAPAGRASLILDAGRGPLDLPAFLAGGGRAFTGDIAIRMGEGNLRLAAGQTITATSVRLTADGGLVDIAGRIDTSGIDGGAIGLFGTAGVRIAGTGRLDTHANGYAASDTRVASGGTIDIGTSGTGVLGFEERVALAPGDTSRQIDVAARRPGARLVASLANNPVTLNDETVYRYAEGDTGGLVRLRAPLIEIAGAPDSVAIDYRGDIFGAREVSIEAVKRYDLATIADCSSGAICINAAGQAVLDVNANGGDNILGGRGPGSISAFVRDFDISGAAMRLGTLPTLAGYIARPGIELDHAGDIVLVSNWNLGAGQVDTAAAMRAELQAGSPLMFENRVLGNGRLTVAPGAEGRIYNEFTDFYYRVGGRAGGAAGVLTLRAGGDLDIRGSITDGFFTFGDQTDPLYISYLLGGGDQLYRPVLNVACGLESDCSSIAAFTLLTVAPPAARGISVSLALLFRGEQPLLAGAPYSAAANTPGALGRQALGAGDPIGSAVLAPRLTDGRAADSFGYRLVAGADSASANAARVVSSATGTVEISGEIGYRVIGERGQPRYDGDLQFVFNENNPINLDGAAVVDTLLDTINSNNAEDLGDRLSRLSLTGAPALTQQFVRARAAAFFANRPGQFQYFGPRGAPTLITASLAVLTEFIKFLDADLSPANLGYSARLNAGQLGYARLQAFAPLPLPTNLAFTRTRVRTGSGAIEIAAARDVDLRNGERPTLRNAFNRSAAAPSPAQAQVGGSAVYTAGVRAALGNTVATESGTGRQLTVDTSAFVNTQTSAGEPQRLFNGVLASAPVYLTGGGAVSVSAGRDVLARRDVHAELTRTATTGTAPAPNSAGSATQLWRVGGVANGSDNGIAGGATILGINPQLFSTGIATLGGGDIKVAAGRDVRELTIAADTSVTSGTVAVPARLDAARALATFGGGDVDVRVGRDLLGGLVDVAMGTGSIAVERSIASSGLLATDFDAATPLAANRLTVRLTDAKITANARQSIAIGDILSLGVGASNDRGAAAFFTAASGIALRSDGSIQTLRTAAAPEFNVIAPASLEAISLFGDLDLADSVLFPSSTGQLRLFAGGNLAPMMLAMDDGDASLAPGALSAFSADTPATRPRTGLRLYEFPAVYPDSTDADRRILHNERITHLGDSEPIRIAVDGSIAQLSLSAPKATRLSAGVDLIDTMFFGQNLATTDVTRITAGRDIVATSRILPVSLITRLPVLQGNNFVIGGPGTVFVEAGRDLGPFLNSATVRDTAGNTLSYAGGLITVGNEYNPWLGSAGAKLYAEFGVAGGADYDALRNAYVDPANTAEIDGDLFVQIDDGNGNPGPDRSRPIYAPILIDYMAANFAPLLQARYGTTAVSAAQAYAVFLDLPALAQRQFLLDQVYFNELAAPSRPDGPSFNQFVRSYRAVDLLFPASRGYTANDLSGASNGGTRMLTGNLDLRLAAIESSRGGDVTILGPGGRVLAGSVVLTAAQAARRGQDVAGRPRNVNLFAGVRRGDSDVTSPALPIVEIPRGFEGVLSLRGGAIRSFTDGDFLLNQSRVFTQTGGNITLFSSNGDLNAGQGPRSGANFPPVVLRFTPNGFGEVDSAGAVSGAGIAAFQPRPDVPAPDVILVAPAGTVDAGDAGVRAGGNVFIAAAQVANADAISAGGSITGAGIAGPVDTSAAAAASSASAAAAQAVAGINPANRPDGDRTRVTVDVLGFGGDPSEDPCNLPAAQRPTNCPVPTTNP